MSVYHKVITEATGVTNFNDLEEIEDTMRHCIFHSTLNWQTRAQLKKAAREGWDVVQFERSPEGQAMYAEMMAA